MPETIKGKVIGDRKLGAKLRFCDSLPDRVIIFGMSDNQSPDLDPKFYERADAHINLSNAQLDDINPGKVSTSMMYATARFNAYVSWIGFGNADDMAKAREETIKYFVEQYRLMLEENLDDYIRNFERYRRTPGGQHPDDPKP